MNEMRSPIVIDGGCESTCRAPTYMIVPLTSPIISVAERLIIEIAVIRYRDSLAAQNIDRTLPFLLALVKPVKPLQLLRPPLGAQVPVGRRQLRVAKEVADEHRVRRPRDQAAGGVAQSVKLDWPESSGRAPAFVSTPQRRSVEAPAPSVTENVVVRLGEFISGSKAG